MTGPPIWQFQFGCNRFQRNSLSGKKLPLARVISLEYPAHNGETHTGCLDKARP